MFGMGMQEILIVLGVALIVIGPKKLPDLARSLGRAMGEFKKASRDFKSSFYADEHLTDVKSTFNSVKNDAKNAIDLTPDPEPAETEKDQPVDHETPPPDDEDNNENEDDKGIKAEEEKKVSDNG